jgi:hypothetical protein
MQEKNCSITPKQSFSAFFYLLLANILAFENYTFLDGYASSSGIFYRRFGTSGTPIFEFQNLGYSPLFECPICNFIDHCFWDRMFSRNVGEKWPLRST